MVDKEVKTNVNPLEQFILLAKGTRGAAIISLINQVIETPGIYVFGELLQVPNIRELEKGDGAPYWRLLNIFAYGRYSDYKANKNTLPDLSAAQIVKLQHLTIISLASESKYISYSLLLQELGISNVRELEDLIIEAIYADIVHGKLDQTNSQLEVEYVIGRDIKPDNVNSIVSVLEEWCSSCESVLHGIEKQIQRTNNYRDAKSTHNAKFQSELENLKAVIKATGSQELEDNTRYDGTQGNPFVQCSTQRNQRLPNQGSARGIRGAAKFFTSKR